mgnify:FL=1
MRGLFARYARSGHLLYVTATGTLMAAAFDQDRMALTGTPVALLEGISIRRGGGGVDLTVSDNGTLWYGLGTSFRQSDVIWASRAGAATEVVPGWTGDFATVALSPDGTRLAIAIVDGTGEQIWVRRLGPSTSP